jgi:hypothetical protein
MWGCKKGMQGVYSSMNELLWPQLIALTLGDFLLDLAITILDIINHDVSETWFCQDDG